MGRCRMYFALVVMCALGALNPSAAWSSGRLRVDNSQIDVGKVMAGSAAVGSFVFHNDGDRDITILQAKPS